MLSLANLVLAGYTSLVHQVSAAGPGACKSNPAGRLRAQASRLPHKTPHFSLAVRLPCPQRGPIAAAAYLREQAALGTLRRADFLMPCHSAPLYSETHARVPLLTLDCSPECVVSPHATTTTRGGQ